MEDNLENKNEEQKEETKTYTAEEVAALLQKEGDRRVSEALKKAEKKKDAAVKEAEKLAKMNEEEKYKYELEQREKAVADKERQIALLENRAEASKALASRGISIELVDLVVAEDADTMLENIKKIEKYITATVNTKVKETLSADSPKKNINKGELTADTFKQLSVSEQQELFDKDPELYNKLLGI